MKTAPEELASNSMDVDQLQKSAPSPAEDRKFTEKRANFVNRKTLLERYRCAICHDILVKPHQTPCGNRGCKSCFDTLFGNRDHILPCPMTHDDMDEDDLEECQNVGLFKSDINPDHAVTNSLQKEKCFCSNQPYGCCEKIPLRKLKDHEMQCEFKPQPCPNKGCPEFFATPNISGHLERCQYTDAKCSYCHQSFSRKDIENHVEECDLAETQCAGCGRSFGKRKLLLAHQQINPDCLTRAGRCYYYDYCRFESLSIGELQQHLREKKDEHLEYLTLQVQLSSQSAAKAQVTQESELKKAVNRRVKPLEKVTAELSMKVVRYGKLQESSSTNGEALQNAMRVVNNTSVDVESVKGRVTQIERQIKDSGLDRVTVIESHSQSIRRSNELLSESDKRIKNLESTSYDGTLVWKIKDYKKKKSDAVRGKQMSIYSHPFYTSRTGYKLCLRAYINGDGLGRGKCLSLFFVVMRGEFDELLQFPFKQRVTFSLVCPSNPELNKCETFLPDPDSSSFRRPQTEMNIASGCPQFAPHSLVESSNFLLNDCIYIKAVVEPGGGKI